MEPPSEPVSTALGASKRDANKQNGDPNTRHQNPLKLHSNPPYASSAGKENRNPQASMPGSDRTTIRHPLSPSKKSQFPARTLSKRVRSPTKEQDHTRYDRSGRPLPASSSFTSFHQSRNHSPSRLGSLDSSAPKRTRLNSTPKRAPPSGGSKMGAGMISKNPDFDSFIDNTSSIDESRLVGEGPSELEGAQIDDSRLSTFSAIPNPGEKFLGRSHISPAKMLTASIRSRINPHKSFKGSPDRTSAVVAETEARPARPNNPKLAADLQRQRNPALGPKTPPRESVLNMLNLDITHAPTPKSIPTITIRELETLKSEYLSVISSLKASLSGREAEVQALKAAIADAERRGGEAQEALREERASREHAEEEVKALEQHHIEVRKILDGAKKELIKADNEKEELEARLQETEKLLEEANERSLRVPSAVSAALDGSERETKLYTGQQVQEQIDSKIQGLSTELHSIYKKKHLTKVAGLKRGFEEKTKKMETELNEQIQALTKKLEQNTNDGETARANSRLTEVESRLAELQKLHDEQRAILETQRATILGLQEEVKSTQASNEDLILELENERIEKGELVAAVDEMLALQADGQGLYSLPTDALGPSSPAIPPSSMDIEHIVGSPEGAQASPLIMRTKASRRPSE